MTKQELHKIADEIQAIIEQSKATFFVNKDEPVEIPIDEALYEQKAEISNNIGMYFVRLLDNINSDENLSSM